MGDLRLKLLGKPELRRDGVVVAFPTKKTLALFAYLVVERGLHAREKLAALLWPESDESRARGTLRYTLANLKSRLGEDSCLVAQRDALGIDDRASLEVDVQALESAYAEVRASPDDLPVLTLQRTAELCTGEFLEGFSLPDAAGFDEWALQQQAHYRQRIDVLLDRFSQSCEARGALVDATDLVRRWLSCNPFNESAHRRLMRVQLAQGDRAAALRAYESCRLLLASELGAEPAPKTEALAERIRRDSSSVPDVVRPRGRIAPVLSAPPLVGRGREFAELVERYRSACRGGCDVALLVGEAGIGKTRLATEFLTWADAEGADVLRGRAFETGSRLPYQPLVDALRPRVERENAPDDLLDDVWLTELSRLLAELRERYPDLPAPAPDEATARTHLYEAVSRLVSQFATHAPVVLLIDDVQWADEASLDVLLYAAKAWNESGTRVMLLLAVRSEALARLQDWLTRLQREAPVARIELGALTLSDTRQLMLALTQTAADSDRFADWLHAETDGQPFFMTETLRALMDRGHLLARCVREQWTLEIEPGLERRAALREFLPPGVQQLIRTRLERLTADARALLSAAAVLAQAFSFDHLRRVAELPENDALAAIEELVRVQLLREAIDRDPLVTVYYFSHDKIRDVVQSDTGDARRRVFHRRALEVLVSSGVTGAEIARHALAAGCDEIAALASLRAGDDAMSLLAARDAIAHFTRTIELARRLGRVDLAIDAQVRRAEARASIAQWAGAKHDLEEAIQQLAPGARERRAELLVDLSEACFWLLEVPAVHRYSALALSAAEELGRRDLEMAARCWVGGAHGADGELEAAIPQYEHALKIAHEIGAPPPAHLLTRQSLTLYWLGRAEDALLHSRAGVDLARASNDASSMMYSLPHLGLSLAATGRYQEAASVFEEARRYGREHRVEPLLARSIAMSTGFRIDVFDFARAEELSRQARELAMSVGWSPAVASSSIDLSFAFARRGEVGRAEELIDQVAQTVAKAAGFHGWLWRLRLSQVRAEIALARGNWNDARVRARESTSAAAKAQRVKYRVLGLTTGAQALVALGERERAVADLAEALALARATGDPALLLRVAAALMPLAGDDALLAEARSTLERVRSALPDAEARICFEQGARALGLPA